MDNITFEIVLAFLGSGIGASLLTEAVSFFNKKATGTPLHGMGALIISGGLAFLVGALQVYAAGIPAPTGLADILSITGAIWLASQAFFHLILKRIDTLHVTLAANDTHPLF